MRSDASLKVLYDGPQKQRGNRRRYDGKVNLADPSRFTFVETSLADGVSLYAAVAWSVSLKRCIRLAYLRKDAALRSTHANPDALLRFSIASLKRQALNEHLLDLFTATFDLEPALIKSHPNDQTLLNYGVIAT